MSDSIKVAIRVRPLISREKNEKLKEQWEVHGNLIYPIDTNGKKNGDSYIFDHIFDSQCSNVDIYNTVVHPVVDAAMNGFNGTIFAYGQTSSGKTYTMMGNQVETGLLTIAVKNIFDAIHHAVDKKFLIRVSSMEIYNEKIYDLLDIRNAVSIHENTNGIVLNLKEEYTDCPEKIYKAMKTGDKARRIGETNMNEKSSRSHVIFRIIIESSDLKNEGVVNVAHLNLVDLAGSERVSLTKATGIRLKEGSHINKSLSTLSLVMKQLSESQDFVSFRNSQLTRILQSSLGGNALTAIICAITPAALEESHSTLAFASRAKTVKNKPYLNEVLTDEAVIIRYATQIKNLKKDLEKAKDQAKFHGNLQEKIDLIEKYMIYSSRSSDKKKFVTNRRQTWCAPRRDDLPVIYETDILKSQNDILSTIADSDDCLDNEMFPDTVLDFEIESRNLPCTQRKMHHTYSAQRSLYKNKAELSKPVVSDTENKNDKVSEDTTEMDSKEVVKWLINDTETPKSVLRDRASYYNNELTTLKELTDKEKELLCTEHFKETESLHFKIEQLENDLEYEKSIKNQLESEKNIMHDKYDELKKKNAELSRINFQLQKEQNKSNDSDYMLEMMLAKFKKREKELLEQLLEARKGQTVINKISSEDVITPLSKNPEILIQTDIQCSVATQTNEIIQSSVATQIDVTTQFNTTQSNTTQTEVSTQFDGTTQTDITSISNIGTQCEMTEFDSVIKSVVSTQTDVVTEFNDSVTNTIVVADEFDETEVSALSELSSKLKSYKTKVNSIKEKLISSDYIGPDLIMTFTELNKKSDELSNDLKIYYSEDVQQQFTTLKSMLQNITCLFTFEKIIKNNELEITKYVNRIAHNQKKELTYEKLVKEQGDEIKNVSKKLLETMQREQELKDQLALLEIEKEELIESMNIEYKKLKKEYEENINVKDKEIEELSDKIMEYLDLISPLEEEVKKYKDNSRMIDSQNSIIEELNNKLSSCNVEVVSLTEEIEQLKINLELKSQEIDSLNKELENKNIILENKSEEITDLIKEKLELQNEEFKQVTLVCNEKNLELEKKNAEIIGLREQASLSNTEYKNKISDLINEINAAENQISQLVDELNAKEKLLNKETYNATIGGEANIKLKLLDASIAKNEPNEESKNIDIQYLKEKITDYEEKIKNASSALENYEKILLVKNRKIQHYKNDLYSNKNLTKQLLNEIELLNEKIITYESHSDTLANQLEQHIILLETGNKEIFKNNHEILNLQKEIICYQTKCEKLQTKLNIQAVAISKLDIQINEDNKITTQLIAEAESKIDNLNGKITEKKQILETSPDNLKNLIINYSRELEQLNLKENQFESNKMLLKQKQNEITQLTSELFEINEKVELFKANIDALDKEKESLEQQIVEFKNRESEFKSINLQIENKDLEIETLISELKHLKNQVQVHECNIQNLNSTILLHKNQVDEYCKTENMIHEKNAEKEILNKKLNEFHEQQKKFIDNIELLKEQIISKTMELEVYLERESKLKLNKQLIEETDHEISSLCEEIKNCEDQLQNYNIDVKILTNVLTSSSNLLKNIENKQCCLNNEIDSLRNSLQHNNQEIIELKNTILSLNNQINDLTKERDVVQEQLKFIKSQNFDEKNNILNLQIDQIQKQIQDMTYHEKLLNEKIEILNNNCLVKDQINNDLTDDFNKITDELQYYKNKLIEHDKEIEIYKARVLKISQLDEKCTLELSTALKTEISKLEIPNEFIETLKKYSNKIESCNNVVNHIRSQLEKNKIMLKTREEQLNIILSKIMKHLNPKCEISINTDIEIFTQQCNLIFTKNEITELQNKCTKIKQKANSQFIHFKNILRNVQSENEKLKTDSLTNIKLIKSLEENLQELKNENDALVGLQSKMTSLKQENLELNKLGNYLQEQTTAKINELKDLKNHLKFLKHENAELLKSNADYIQLKNKLIPTEESLRTAQMTLKQLEMEKDNFSATCRTLEESLEDTKFELHSLKIKERDKIKKNKRRSLHDSFRMLAESGSADNQPEDLNKSDEVKNCKDLNKSDEAKKYEEDEIQIKERDNEIQRLQTEVKTLRRKYDTCKNLCVLRRLKIEQLLEAGVQKEI